MISESDLPAFKDRLKVVLPHLTAGSGDHTLMLEIRDRLETQGTSAVVDMLERITISRLFATYRWPPVRRP